MVPAYISYEDIKFYKLLGTEFTSIMISYYYLWMNALRTLIGSLKMILLAIFKAQKKLPYI